MPHPSSFLRSWRRKDRLQTSPTRGSVQAVEVHFPPRSSNRSPTSVTILPKRRPSDSPSETSTRFLWLFKGNYTEPDGSSLAETGHEAEVTAPPRAPSSAVRRPHSPPFHYPPTPTEQISPLSSPHSLNRPLPSVPPLRPPRPPSLNLDSIELSYVPSTPPTRPESKSRSRSIRPAHPPIPELFPRRKLPELDNVWEGFMKDVEGEDVDPFMIPARPKDRPYASNSSVGSQRVQAMLDPPSAPQMRPTLYRAWGSESTPYLAYNSRRTSDSDSDYSNEDDAISLFPDPPPLNIRRRLAPKPLVLLPTPTIAPLPPSPSYSSRDSTPVATPTTPRSARKSMSPVSILKKPGTYFSARCLDATPTPPDSPTTPTRGAGFGEHSHSSRNPPPHLRSTQSVPHFQKSSLPNTHRNATSDTTSMNRMERVSLIPNGHGKQQLFQPLSAPAAGTVEWGYAV
ncbi:hypothetical protein DFH07DRAFT_43478 [Mycena maculata]|uniref:Uncharacterized protein n=1 Tax=Mycena maculata TaxID=230809 RepID=A0AAD7IGD8_9AGAR|nr:hypothetical protein DFH07DRAFT_43478 [Mycena maculata]